MGHNEPDKAIPFLQTAIHIADSIQDLQNLSGSYSLLAQIYVGKKKFEEAGSLASKALGYAQQYGNRTQEGVIYDLFCNMYKEQQEYAKAISEGLKAYTILKEEKNVLREQTIAATLSEVYEKVGNTAEAYKFLKISASLNDNKRDRVASNSKAVDAAAKELLPYF